MAEYKFGVTGQGRKELVNAISEILETKAVYMKTPTYAYAIGNISIDKNGTGTGEFSPDLLAELAERGFQAEIETPEAETPSEPEAADETESENTEPEVEISEETGETEAETAPEADAAEESADRTSDDLITIEYPLTGFNPERLDNLIKLVESKAILIKQVLGATELPIRVLSDRLAFPWFSNVEDGDANAYAQFIAALCETAKEKRRVTAKPLTSIDNPRFTMRVWITGLGLIGREYDRCRKLMVRGLSGDSGHRYGKPSGDTSTRKRDGIQREVISIRLTPETLEKLNILAAKAESESGQRISRNMLIEQAVETFVEAEYETAALEAETAQAETTAEDTPADAQPEAETENVVAYNADTAEVEGEVDGE